MKYFLQFENYLVEGFLGTQIGNKKYLSEKIRKLRKTRFPLNHSVRSPPVCPLQGRGELLRLALVPRSRLLRAARVWELFCLLQVLEYQDSAGFILSLSGEHTMGCAQWLKVSLASLEKDCPQGLHRTYRKLLGNTNLECDTLVSLPHYSETLFSYSQERGK